MEISTAPVSKFKRQRIRDNHYLSWTTCSMESHIVYGNRRPGAGNHWGMSRSQRCAQLKETTTCVVLWLWVNEFTMHWDEHHCIPEWDGLPEWFWRKMFCTLLACMLSLPEEISCATRMNAGMPTEDPVSKLPSLGSGSLHRQHEACAGLHVWIGEMSRHNTDFTISNELLR